MKRVTAAVIGAGCATAVAAGYYLLSPYGTVVQCKDALVELNSERVSKCIDFPALRETLKSELSEKLEEHVRQHREFRDNPVAKLRIALLKPIVARVIDAYITPSGLRAAFELAKSNQSGKQARTTNEGEVAAANKSTELSKSLIKSSFGYQDLDRFQVTGVRDDGSIVTLLFSRQGFADWKLTGISF